MGVGTIICYHFPSLVIIKGNLVVIMVHDSLHSFCILDELFYPDKLLHVLSLIPSLRGPVDELYAPYFHSFKAF